MNDPTDNFYVRHNASWLASVRIGLTTGVVYAPLRLWDIAKMPILTVLSSTGLLVVAIFTWALGSLIAIAAGVCGFASETVPVPPK